MNNNKDNSNISNKIKKIEVIYSDMKKDNFSQYDKKDNFIIPDQLIESDVESDNDVNFSIDNWDYLSLIHHR